MDAGEREGEVFFLLFFFFNWVGVGFAGGATAGLVTVAAG